MKRAAICVDASYLFAQGGIALSGAKKPRSVLLLDAQGVLNELNSVVQSKAPGCPVLRVYWYDGALASRGPTLEQEQLAHLDNIKVRLGFINSAGQQKGVDSLTVTDLIELARLGAICDAVLLSGDEDVRIGVQIAQNYGVRIHLVGIAPSRGSQSKSLLQEVDTTTEWSTATVAKFLSVRSIPAVASPTTVATFTLPARSPAVSAAASQPAPTAALALAEKVASCFADTISDADVKSLIAYWATQRGVPPEFDGKLLARSRSDLGRDLDEIEKRFLRRKFADSVRSRGASLP